MATLCFGLAAAAGCTMCPDPFDYSGPVPNGSTPQNDFRARSRGILPLGAAPRPWPQVVQDDGTAGAFDLEAVPQADDPDAERAEDVGVQQTGACLPAPEAAAEPDRGAFGVADASPESPAAPSSLPEWPRGETPGWRARHSAAEAARTAPSTDGESASD